MNLILTHVSERDMDLLFVEEIENSQSFREFLLHQAGITTADHTGHRVQHSVERTGEGYGETDIEVNFELENGQKIAILFENKIDSPFTPNQAKRYQAHAQ